MGASNETALLKLPLFSDDDRPTWRGDVNGANNSIDAGYGTLTGQINNIVVNFDQTTANNIGTVASKSRKALETLFYVVDTDYATLELALASVPNYGTLEIRGNWTRTTEFLVNKPCTVRFAQSGSITNAAIGSHGITITANDVTLINANLTGAGATTAGTKNAVNVQALATAPVNNLKIVSPRINGWDYAGIYLINVTNFTITDVQITNVAYGGVLIGSGINGKVEGGYVDTVTQPTGFVNSYGFSATRDYTKSFTDAPRSSNIKFKDLTASNIPQWEGFDTHAGSYIQFLSCRAINTYVGFAIVNGKSQTSGNSAAYAPQYCTVKDCYADSTMTDGSRSCGIQVAGASTTVGSPTELAMGCVIEGNTVINHGIDVNPVGSGSSAISAYGTTALKIVNNTIIQPASFGIDIYYDNYGAKVAGNNIIDVWATNSPFSAAINVRSTYNTAMISGTMVSRATKIATHVNDRGITITTSPNNTISDGGGNVLNAATLPVNGASSLYANNYANSFTIANAFTSLSVTTNAVTLAGLMIRSAAGGTVLQISPDGGTTWKTVSAT